MNPPIEAGQRIGSLSSLAEVFAAVDGCAQPVGARALAVAEAAGRVLAADVVALHESPVASVADRDGWAVRAEFLADAGPYAPVPLTPAPTWVDSGAALPPGCDAVLAPDGLTLSAAGAEVIAAVAPGEDVRPAGSDAGIGTVLFPPGARLRASDLALLRALGIVGVNVRMPHVMVIAAHARATVTAEWTVAMVEQAGGTAELAICEAGALARMLEASVADAVVVVGGSGQGRADRSAQALAAAGRLMLHGMGIRPGETAGFGTVGARPVLLLPGRIDAALAVWLLVGRRLLARLTGVAAADLVATDPAPRFTLRRKLTGTIGFAEVVLVGRSGEGVEPIAARSFPLQAMARAAGWVLVPPESEGYPSGATVAVNPLP